MTRTKTLSNGNHYTNSYGDCTIPFLYDPNVPHGVAGPIRRQTTRTYCDSCGNQTRDEYIHGIPVFEHTYPCVLLADRDIRLGIFESLPGIYSDGTIEESATEVACDVEFLLCDKCSIRADAIMEVSDHIARGENWWLICRRLSDKIYDEELWEKWEGGSDILKASAVKTMALIHHAVNGKDQTGLFSLLPRDVLSMMAPHVLESEKDKFARKIQSLWRGYRVRAHPEAKRWYLGCGKTLYQSQCENLWAKCDDCGMKRHTADMFIMEACADHTEFCPKKIVCREACCYTCPACSDTNFVKCDDKNMNGSPTFFDCLCGESFLLNEQWWGQSEAEHQRRYG